MKKNYLKPTTEIALLECSPLLTASLSVSLSDDTPITSPSNVLSPELTFSDDLEDF